MVITDIFYTLKMKLAELYTPVIYLRFCISQNLLKHQISILEKKWKSIFIGVLQKQMEILF